MLSFLKNYISALKKFSKKINPVIFLFKYNIIFLKQHTLLPKFEL